MKQKSIGSTSYSSNSSVPIFGNIKCTLSLYLSGKLLSALRIKAFNSRNTAYAFAFNAFRIGSAFTTSYRISGKIKKPRVMLPGICILVFKNCLIYIEIGRINPDPVPPAKVLTIITRSACVAGSLSNL
jgi:hypothetical protein